MTFSDKLSPRIWSARFSGRRTWPSVNPAAAVQASIAPFTQVGIGIGAFAHESRRFERCQKLAAMCS